MSRKTIAPLPSGHYWATPHAPFALDGPNGHDEVFPGAHCVSDGKWVTFYKNGEEVWACNAMYAAAHFDVPPLSSACASTADLGAHDSDRQGYPPHLT
ncbi:hypothetical protein [Cupriavidus necator]|nr:hypothetical protein [Cupriavidus necator]